MEIRREAFFWFPREENTKYRIDISSVDRTDDILDSEFTDTVAPEIGDFKISLDNNDGVYTNLYQGNEQVDFYLDFDDQTTKRWRGRIEKIKYVWGGSSGNIIELEGYTSASELLDITVTEQISSTVASTVLTNLVSTYLTGFTTTNVSASTTSVTVTWNQKPFWECISELCEIAGFDCFVDVNKDFHFFQRGSRNNENEAIVWSDNLINVEGLVEETVDIKNKVTVYGEDDEGLPIVFTQQDSASQSQWGVKEKVIKDTSVGNYTQASNTASFNLQSNTETKGRGLSFLLPSLRPGDSIWVTNPPQKVHNIYRIVKYTHKIPEQNTEVVITQNKELPLFLKDRVLKEQAQEGLTNPYKMQYSYNFPFDDQSNVLSLDSNLTISGGELRMASGSSGQVVSAIRQTVNPVTQVHVILVGESLSNITVEVNSDGTNFEVVPIESLYILTLSAGNQLQVRFTLNSTSSVLKSAVILYK